MADIRRRKTGTVKIGQVRVGWEVPVVVQSMTNTDTADIAGTIEQVAALALGGCGVCRARTPRPRRGTRGGLGGGWGGGGGGGGVFWAPHKKPPPPPPAT